MGFQATQSVYKPVFNYPMYGMSVQEVADVALVLSLTRFTDAVPTLNHDFALNAPTNSGLFMYWASPVSMGEVQFYDVDSQFIGGWDGANNDPYEIYGPIILNIPSPSGIEVPFYVYRTDYSDLGPCRWQSSLAV